MTVTKGKSDESDKTGNNDAPPAKMAVVDWEQENADDGEQAQKNLVGKEQKGEKVEKAQEIVIDKEQKVGKVDEEKMDCQDQVQGQKRPHSTDSNSDIKGLQRRQKYILRTYKWLDAGTKI